ncbi:MAG TPA: hypothetical protein VMW79_06095 [Anaerolineae bacterium]|nr:hypothetical protein [Anaerolineae bacterium]HUW95995.1 hypothetical protein [Anaerolineae bacterium]
MERLGLDYDISACVVPVDFTTAINTGLRVCLRDCEGVDFVVMSAVGTAGDDMVIDVQQCNVATGGVPKDLDVITHMFYKSAATLAGSELWVEQTQVIASEIAVTALYPIAEEQDILVLHVEAADMDFAGGYYWAFLTIADTGTNPQLGCVIAIRTGLLVQRKPSNLRNPQA